MTPERFRQIEELYHAAREKTGAERAALLAEANPEMRREVEDLLAQTESGFLAAPAVPISTELADATVTALTGGNCLGPYRIESKLGEGGMGEVFRAVDTRLGRTVAVKVTHAKFGDRFEREARAIAALNHPNICTLHDVGPDYLVMELVEGETLAERIAKGAVPLDEAVAIARQIAEALEAAHEAGIVHRDLKPANVKLRPDGSVKVLDFGLAKDSAEAASVTPNSPTMLSMSGVILGTAGYMAPEQAQGKTVDKRADIWAFGVVFYEILTGARLFKGDTLADTLAA